MGNLHEQRAGNYRECESGFRASRFPQAFVADIKGGEVAWPQQLVDELKRRLAARGWKLEWDVIRQDLAALAQVEVRDEFYNLVP